MSNAEIIANGIADQLNGSRQNINWRNERDCILRAIEPILNENTALQQRVQELELEQAAYQSAAEFEASHLRQRVQELEERLTRMRDCLQHVIGPKESVERTLAGFAALSTEQKDGGKTNE